MQLWNGTAKTWNGSAVTRTFALTSEANTTHQSSGCKEGSLWPHHPERAGSLPISEAEQAQAWLARGREDLRKAAKWQQTSLSMGTSCLRQKLLPPVHQLIKDTHFSESWQTICMKVNNSRGLRSRRHLNLWLFRFTLEKEEYYIITTVILQITVFLPLP